MKTSTLVLVAASLSAGWLGAAPIDIVFGGAGVNVDLTSGAAYSFLGDTDWNLQTQSLSLLGGAFSLTASSTGREVTGFSISCEADGASPTGCAGPGAGMFGIGIRSRPLTAVDTAHHDRLDNQNGAFETFTIDVLAGEWIIHEIVLRAFGAPDTAVYNIDGGADLIHSGPTNLYSFGGVGFSKLEIRPADRNSQMLLYRIQVEQVPEPSTWLLMGSGVAGLALLRRRRSY